MFVKKKNLRKAGAARKIGADSDEDDATPAAPTAAAKPAGGKAKGPRPAKAALVSFDDEEEEPVVIIKPKKKLEQFTCTSQHHEHMRSLHVSRERRRVQSALP